MIAARTPAPLHFARTAFTESTEPGRRRRSPRRRMRPVDPIRITVQSARAGKKSNGNDEVHLAPGRPCNPRAWNPCFIHLAAGIVYCSGFRTSCRCASLWPIRVVTAYREFSWSVPPERVSMDHFANRSTTMLESFEIFVLEHFIYS